MIDTIEHSPRWALGIEPARTRKATISIIRRISPRIKAIIVIGIHIFGRLVRSRHHTGYFRKQTFIISNSQIQLSGIAGGFLETLLALGALGMLSTTAPLTTELIGFLEVATAEVKVDFIIGGNGRGSRTVGGGSGRTGRH